MGEFHERIEQICEDNTKNDIRNSMRPDFKEEYEEMLMVEAKYALQELPESPIGMLMTTATMHFELGYRYALKHGADLEITK